jgi:hypothetical protein
VLSNAIDLGDPQAAPHVTLLGSLDDQRQRAFQKRNLESPRQSNNDQAGVLLRRGPERIREVLVGVRKSS